MSITFDAGNSPDNSRHVQGQEFSTKVFGGRVELNLFVIIPVNKNGWVLTPQESVICFI
jgi:hypothetical protein